MKLMRKRISGFRVEVNAVDEDRLRWYHEDADSIPYVQQRSEHAEE